MKHYFSKYIIFLFIIVPVAWIVSCSGRPGKPSEKVSAPALVPEEDMSVKLIKIESPGEDAGFKLREPIKIVLGLLDSDRVPDSVVISYNGNPVSTLKSLPLEYTVPSSKTVTTGRKSLKIVAYRGGRSQAPLTRFLVIFSDIVPKRYGYKVVHQYPHDTEAFTQGFVYDKGVFYEGTGQKNGSSLREVEPETGKVIRQHNLDANLFGEGITLYKDRIYEVTWENKVGFVYDKATFDVINKIYYPTQGWGLTTIGDKIVMSDGSNVLAFYEPEMFTAVSRIEVYDNEKKVDSLNELEYINGEIWANIWMTDLIARIDPMSGKVLGYIDLKNILPESEKNSGTDVLNGIAYDKEGGRIFVTGKRWPKVYEIKVTG